MRPPALVLLVLTLFLPAAAADCWISVRGNCIVVPDQGLPGTQQCSSTNPSDVAIKGDLQPVGKYCIDLYLLPEPRVPPVDVVECDTGHPLI